MSYTRVVAKYIVDKALTYFSSFLTSIVLLFIIPRLVPGSPMLRGGSFLDPLTYRRLMGLCICPNCPPWCLLICDFIQYFVRVFTFNFGISLAFFPKKVSEVLLEHLPYTLILLMPAALVSYIVGNILASHAIYKRGVLDTVVVSLSAILSNIPPYILASALLFVFAVQIKIFPVGGTWTIGLKPSLSPVFIVDFLWHYILPFLSITIVLTSLWTIRTRFLLLSESSSDYVEYLELIGLSSRKVSRYILRSGISTQLTLLAIEMSTLLAGQTIVERVFNYQGIGFVIAIASSSLDYPLIEGIFIVIIGVMFLANFIIDIVYILLDPRILLRTI